MQGLPDYLSGGMRVLFIGYNPGLRSAELGHHYAGKGNAFFPLLFRGGLVDVPVPPLEDYTLLPRFGYGLTNLVERPTTGIKDLNAEDYREGREVLRKKLIEFRPQIAAYIGLGVYRHFAERAHVEHGLQEPGVVGGVLDFVLPSTSGLNAIPLAEKERWFRELKTLLNTINE